MKRLLFLGAIICLGFAPTGVRGQSGAWDCACPTDTLFMADTTQNHPGLYHGNAWLLGNFPLSDRGEGPAVLRLDLPDSCHALVAQVRYELDLDLDDNGIPESRVRSDQAPPPGKLNVDNIFNTGTLQDFDQRLVPDSLKFVFGLKTDNHSYQVIWRRAGLAESVPELPYGLHRIRWIVTDSSGLERECTYWFRVQDAAPPLVHCLPGSNIEIVMHFVPITIWADIFLTDASDNYLPREYLTLGIRKTGTGSGFPMNGNGTPSTFVKYDCMDLGPQTLEVWCKDDAGNSAYCTVSIFLKTNLNNCNFDPFLVPIGGNIKKPDGSPVSGVQVDFSQFTAIFTPIVFVANTDTNGAYWMGHRPVLNPTPLIPRKNQHFLNGVSTFDLVLMSKHILGIAPFTTPYQLIAADVNRSGSVTNFDIIETRKLILGIYDTFPNNSSWRFLHYTQTFSNPANPFLDSLTESTIIYPSWVQRDHEDFTAIKIGDVNNTAIGSATQTDERSRTPFALYLPDAELRAGDILDLRLEADAGALGLQFTLELGDLELLGLSPENGMTAEHFGIFPEAITCAWEQEKPAAFRLRLRARKPVRLHEQLRISDRITRAEAYRNGATQVPELVFGQNSFEKTAILYQNQPNPFSEQTLVPFYLPESGAVRLLVQDALGRVVFTQNGFFEKGQQQWVLRRQDIPAPGVYTCTLETIWGSKSIKMVAF